MAEIQELKEDLLHAIRTQRDTNDKRVNEKRNFTNVELDEIKVIDADIERLRGEIVEGERTEAIANRIEAVSKEIRSPQARVTAPAPVSPTGAPPVATGPDADYPATMRRSRLMRGFPQTIDGERSAYKCGMWLMAALGVDKARRWCTNHNIETRIMTEGINTAGGVLVHDELSQRIIDLREQYGVMRKESYIEPMSQDVKIVARQTGGVTPYFVGEGASITASQSTWDNVKLTANKLAAMSRISSELYEDAVIDLADKFVTDVAQAFALKEDQCCFIGDGTSTYGGITGICIKIIEAAHTASRYAPAGIDLMGEVTDPHLWQVMGQIPQYAIDGGNCKWYMSRSMWAGVFQRLAAAVGNVDIRQREDPVKMEIFGYPVVIVQVMGSGTPATIFNLETMFLFGDMRMATTFGDRRGIEVAKSTEKFWDTDETALKATQRFDFNAHQMGTTAVAGPMIAFRGTT